MAESASPTAKMTAAALWSADLAPSGAHTVAFAVSLSTASTNSPSMLIWIS